MSAGVPAPGVWGTYLLRVTVHLAVPCGVGGDRFHLCFVLMQLGTCHMTSQRQMLSISSAE
jgi:hypothetical protein